MARIALGSAVECGQADALKAKLAEFISMLMLVFAGQGSAMAFNKMTDDGSTMPEELVAATMAYAFGIIAAVSMGANISGGYVNPVVTLGALIRGHITLARTILYWIAQCLGSVVACFILKFATGGMTTTTFSISSGLTVWNALVFEIVLTFELVYIVYTKVWDPKRGSIGIMGPIVVGAIVAASILVGAAFEGASMNPALSFGLTVVAALLYWVGQFIGSAIAAILIFFGQERQGSWKKETKEKES